VKTIRGLGGIGLVSLVAATGCSSAAEDEAADIATAQQPILNGSVVTWNSINVVAVYHQSRNAQGKFVWFERPCSGRVLTPRAPIKFILTARHCVTETVNNFAGPVIAASQIRISAELAPGPASPKPPSNAVEPFQVDPFPVPTNGYLGLGSNPLDLAIIRVAGAIPGLETNPPPVGLFLGEPLSALLAQNLGPSGTLAHWGYGQGIDGQNSTAGVLRMASGFVLRNLFRGTTGPVGLDYEMYEYYNPNPSGAAVAFGDSGGPALRQDVFQHQVGVHQGQGSDTTIGRRSMEWIVGGHLDRVYMRPYLYHTRGMKRSSEGAQATVTAVPAAAEPLQWWAHDWEKRAIRAPAKIGGTTCLDLQWNNSADNTPIWMWPCNDGDAQKWVITPYFQIKSEVHNKCIEHMDFRMVLKPCAIVDRQKWIFDPDSGVAGGF
jgi:hypothetical protein